MNYLRDLHDVWRWVRARAALARNPLMELTDPALARLTLDHYSRRAKRES